MPKKTSSDGSGRPSTVEAGEGKSPEFKDLKSSREKKTQELFLPVHGHVGLYGHEVAIVDHPALQRLRRVRQLGLAHMVFPGATHTRFEHSIGAVHVAKLITEHVNENCRTARDAHREWSITEVSEPMVRFIRLGALLHDVGHLPLGHTLEDELNHLPHHDGPERLERVAKISYPEHEVDHQILPSSERPPEGWSLKALIDRLYQPWSEALDISDFSPFAILAHIVCKPPQEVARKAAWDLEAKSLDKRLMLKVCQDIVGNTICADFLDYLYRDWYHLGKPLYFDKRIYQYMEVRTPSSSDHDEKQARFVINVGASEKIRHDALTDILELLNARYKLAQTVLFHRTKLALTALLDRCLLEISSLYERAGLPPGRFAEIAEELLLNASDDSLPLILEQLVEGGDSIGRKRLAEAIQREESAIARETEPAPQPSLIESSSAATAVASKTAETRKPVIRGELAAQKELALQLVHKLRDRDVYSLANKLRMSDFHGPHDPENPRLLKLLKSYKQPKTRLDFLRGMESLCDLPPGTLILNCPSDAAMNAKIAKVSLFIEDEVVPFDRYDRGDSSLTRGALWAQIKRFYELWAASIYVDRRTWDTLDGTQREHLKSLLGGFFFQVNADFDVKVIRAQMQASLKQFQSKASRAGTEDPNKQRWKGFVFASELPFSPDSETP